MDPKPRHLKVLLSAAEVSSDLHGAELVKSLERLAPEFGVGSIEFFGIGGTHLREAGLEAIVPGESLQVMGFVEILGRIFGILGAFFKLLRAAAVRRPDFAVVIDYPEFHFWVARFLFRLKIPVHYWIPPKVWAWRGSRVKTLRRFFRKIFCILPFEVDFYRSRDMKNVSFVGNPIMEELPLRMTPAAARSALGILDKGPVLVALLGSRPSEIRYHFDVVIAAIHRICLELKKEKLASGSSPLQVLIPFAGGFSEMEFTRLRSLLENFFSEEKMIRLRVSRGDAAICMKAADVGIIKSGTSTLEAAVLGLRHVIVYRGNLFSQWIFKNLVRYRGAVGLSNLITHFEKEGPWNFPELLGPGMTVESIFRNVIALFCDPAAKEKQGEALAEVQRRMQVKGAPSELVARGILESLSQGDSPSNGRRTIGVVDRLVRLVVSIVWSAVNYSVRIWVKFSPASVKPLNWQAEGARRPRVISVGNIEAGGTGKTPLVIDLASRAIQSGKSVAVLLRGVGRSSQSVKAPFILRPDQWDAKSRDVGDEGCVIKAAVPQVWLGVGADRRAVFRSLEREAERNGCLLPDLVLLDDGLQQFFIARDQDVVAVTSHSFWRGEGFFREFPEIFRAWFSSAPSTLWVWTKGQERPPMQISDSNFAQVKFRQMGLEVLAKSSETLFLLTTVGEPLWLVKALEKAGLRFAEHFNFGDHGLLTEARVHRIENRVEEVGGCLVMTLKDWVKWREVSKKNLRTHILEQRIEFQKGEDLWKTLI